MNPILTLLFFITLFLVQLALFAQAMAFFRRSFTSGLLTLGLITLTSELMGLPGIAVGRALFASGLVMGLAWSLVSKVKKRSDLPTGIIYSSSLSGISLLFWLWLFRGLACLPSIGDGVHHLFFFSRIEDTLHSLTGHIPLLRSERFGLQFLGFYPSGFHALAAVTSFPASWITHANPLTTLQGISLVILALFPAALFAGIRRVWSELPQLPAALAALWAGFVMIFPLNPMGEGGISRVAGQVLSIPVLWAILGSELDARFCFWLTGLALPVLFWIHPASVIAVAVVLGIRFFQVYGRRPGKGLGPLLAGILGAAVAAVLVRTMIHSGVSDVSNFQNSPTLRKFAETQAWSWHALMDRMKGPIHYFLEDGAGLGKFFSPRSLLAEFGIGLLLFRSAQPRLRPYLVALMILPFALSGLIFSSFPPWMMLGMIFYHSVKRISELFIWPLFLGWAAGFGWLLQKLPRKVFAVIALAALGLVGVSWKKLDSEFRGFHPIYRAPMSAGLNEAWVKIQQEDTPRTLWLCETSDLQPLASLPEAAKSGLRDRLFFSSGTECVSTTANQGFCEKEKRFVEEAQRTGETRWVPLLKDLQGHELGCKRIKALVSLSHLQ